MITARAFAGKHYAVYGLARSGLATVEALLASGAKVTAWDGSEEARKKILPSPSGEGPGVGHSSKLPHPLIPSPEGEGKLTIADLDIADLSIFDSLVVTPGLPLNRHPIAARARDAGVEIIGDIELFARARPELPPHKVVGITGTNGKSTTTSLIHHILQTAGVPSLMGGNIGLPILSVDPLPDGGVYVLELSSYQIDLTQSLDCDVAVLLNITPDHLDRYDSFEAYASSKARLIELQTSAHLWVSTDDEIVMQLWRSLPDEVQDRNVFAFSTREGEVTLIDGLATSRSGRIGFQKNWPSLLGPHNAQNAACAIAACELLGVDQAAISRGLRTYPGLPHRMERIREKDGVTFVNDSKATNPTATAPALAAFERVRWICGGRAKTGDLAECAPFFGHVAKAYTIGEAGEFFASLLSPHMAVAQCETLERAVGEAATEAERGDTVLLSPACASFDQYRDFEARGDEYRKLVGAL